MGTECGECRKYGECSLGFQGISKDSGILAFRGIIKKIPRNVPEDSRELSKIPRDVREDSGECSSNFQRMFKKIPANQNFDLFLEILLVFYQFLLLNCYKVMEKTITQQFFQRKHFLQHFHH